LNESMRSLGAQARELSTLVDRRQRLLDEWIEEMQVWLHSRAVGSSDAILALEAWR
jgi:hypothetical protein